MAGSVNKVILVGNLGRDPEVKFSQDGTKIVNFTMATSDTWKDKNTGERREKTEWHRIVVFNKGLADIIEKYVRKGSKIYPPGCGFLLNGNGWGQAFDGIHVGLAHKLQELAGIGG